MATDFSQIPNLPTLPHVVRPSNDVTPRVSEEVARLGIERQAAVENLIRTEQGENTMQGGSASIAGFGASKLPVFNFLSSLFAGDELTPSRLPAKPQGRGR